MDKKFIEELQKYHEAESDVPAYFYLGIQPNERHDKPEAHYLTNVGKLPVADLLEKRAEFRKHGSTRGIITPMKLAHGTDDQNLDDLHELKKRYNAAAGLAAPKEEKNSVAQFALGLTELIPQVEKFYMDRNKLHHETRSKEFTKSRAPQKPNPRAWTPNGWKK